MIVLLYLFVSKEILPHNRKVTPDLRMSRAPVVVELFLAHAFLSSKVDVQTDPVRGILRISHFGTHSGGIVFERVVVIRENGDYGAK